MSTKIEKSGNKKPSTGQSAPPPSQICRQLERLTLLERGRQVEIQRLTKAQIRFKEIDLNTVERYFDMLEVSEPPSIIAIEDTGANKLFIADGHHRAKLARVLLLGEQPAFQVVDCRRPAVDGGIVAGCLRGLPFAEFFLGFVVVSGVEGNSKSAGRRFSSSSGACRARSHHRASPAVVRCFEPYAKWPVRVLP